MDAKTALAALLGVCSGLTGCGSGGETESGAGAGAQVAAPAAPSSQNVPAPTAAEPQVELLEQNLAYGEARRSNLIGYLAMPADALEPLPGLIVIHEQWGLDDDVRAMTRRLAAQGFIALAVDLYGGAVPATAEDAQRLAAAAIAEPDVTLANLRQAYEYLKKFAFAPAVGAIGWSSGGAWALRTALAMPDDIDALVMYYGQVVTDGGQLETLDMPILGWFAARDESISRQDVQLFRSRLLELGKEVDVQILPNVGHEFANPNDGAYDAKAAETAWQRTIEFLKASL
jgi:carboxymethylenebutenolidase